MKEAVFVLLGAVVILTAGLLAVFGLFQQLLRQQGRILRRIESLEAGGSVAEPIQGLAVGTPVPDFRLPDAVGRFVGPEDLKGRRALLVHWNPQCGFCDLIAPDLVALQPELKRRHTELVLMTYGDVESNRRFAEQHGLDCKTLHLDGAEPVELFASLGTPVAYLLDEQGRIAEPIAVGANDVPPLARRAAESRRLSSERSVDESRLERDGLPAGTPAPTFALPDLDGRTVSLEDYRGRPLLLVFSDPSCGPCDSLAQELARFQREDAGDDLAIVMVSRGDVETSRAKAAEHDFEFPVVIQPGWRISKEYGIFATPVAFLIDEDGVVARDVAKGPQEILALAETAVSHAEVATGVR